MRLVIYGLGLFFDKYQYLIDWEDVVGITDRSADRINKLTTKKRLFFTRDNLSDISFDYIVVFAGSVYWQIKEDLVGNYNVDDWRIIPFSVFKRNSVLDFFSAKDVLVKLIRLYGFHFIYDYHKSILPLLMLNSKELGEEIIISGKVDSLKISANQIYTNYNQAIDLMLIEQERIDTDVLKFLNENKPRFILVFCSYNQTVYNPSTLFKAITSMYVSRQQIQLAEGYLLFLSDSSCEEKLDCKVFIVQHKPYNSVKCNNLYSHVYVGDYNLENRQHEQNGINISSLNQKINECTALYWIWKNTKSQYIGLNHYRRYFHILSTGGRGTIINDSNINYFFRGTSRRMILPQPVTLSCSVGDNIRTAVGDEMYQKAYDIILHHMSIVQFYYIADFKFVLAHHQFYHCNMFIAPWNIFDAYCRWLFSFIIDAAKDFDTTGCDSRQIRTIGYFAETMLTCFLMRENYDILELPITYCG